MTNDLTITRHPISVAWLISDLIGGRLVCRTYLGYTRAKAVAEFIASCKGE